ncbi:MAG TPA: NUDIX domain-containing protein [Pirellulaceae bacterium]|nr:NUDIX domain-containing protein [Planctomycetales bacterium]MCB9936756.1 NUDIX domain-containing protein [Planctomycetaceae bacterium]HRX77488.1 NUDIX domain-containing protein [Pirellulaceae bacterium]
MQPDGQPKRGVVAVVSRGECLLVIRRSQMVVAPGAYCFPGGGIHEGESESAAVVREMCEELNVEVKPRYCLWRSTTSWSVELAWWFVELAADAVLQPNEDEVEQVLWMKPNELRTLANLLESNHHFLDAWERAEFVLPWG